MADMCSCEHASHFNDTEYSPFEPQHEFMGVKAGEFIAAYVGKVCDGCANGHISEYVTNWSN